MRSEDVLAHELGVRRQSTDRFYWDLAVFFNRYDNPIGVPHYLTMDVRLAWEPGAGLEFAVVGQNLLDNHHLEFSDLLMPVTEVPSGVYGMVTWRH